MTVSATSRVEIPKKAIEKQTNDKTATEMAGYKDRVAKLSNASLAGKKLEEIEASIKQLEEIKTSLKAMKLPEGDADLDRIRLRVEIESTLAKYEERKSNLTREAQRKAGAVQAQKQMREMEAAAEKARAGDPSTFKKCEKARNEVEEHMASIRELQNKAALATSVTMQKEINAQAESINYKLDKLNIELSTLDCRRFYVQ